MTIAVFAYSRKGMQTALRSADLFSGEKTTLFSPERIAEDLGEEPTVIAMGERCDQIVPYCRRDIRIDKDLLLKGLRLIYIRNRKQDNI